MFPLALDSHMITTHIPLQYTWIWNEMCKIPWKYLQLNSNIKRLHQIPASVFFKLYFTCYTSSSRLSKTSHLGDLLSEWTLSLSPRLREARDKLETEKTRWREPGCEVRCGTAQHSYTDTTKTLIPLCPLCFVPTLSVTDQCSPSIVTKMNAHIQKYKQNSHGLMHKYVSLHIM